MNSSVRVPLIEYFRFSVWLTMPMPSSHSRTTPKAVKLYMKRFPNKFFSRATSKFSFIVSLLAKIDRKLATWTLDFYMHLRLPCTNSQYCVRFSTSGTTPSGTSITCPDPETLRISIFFVDTIEEFGSPWDPNWLISPLPPADTLKYVS